jgi:mono/diheme cytochrome c family protein
MRRERAIPNYSGLLALIVTTACCMCCVGKPEPSNGEVTPEALGISFSPGSASTLRIERNGRTYEVNLAERTIRDVGLSTLSGNKDSGNAKPDPAPDGATIFTKNCATCHGADAKGIAGVGTPDFTNATTQTRLKNEQIVSTIENGKPGTMMPAWVGKLSQAEILSVAAYLRSLAPGGSQGQTAGQPSTPASRIYQPGDDYLFSLPTGRRLEAGGLYVNFAHRFAFDPAFSGVARGYALLGLDGFSLSSFGLRYGVTKNFSVSLYRSPTFISRPIQMMGAYNFLCESDGAPLNVTGRLSIEGQNDFSRNFAGSFEMILSRSLGRRAQLYFVPTVSLGARHLFSPNSYVSSAIPNLPSYTTVSTGIGGALDIRPTVALVAEVIPTLVNGAPLGIHRAAYAFGIQKKIWRHAFTFGFTTAPATTVSQRAATAAALLNNPEADEPRGLFIGFNLTRELF